jgi:hypothetical protein
MQQFRLRTLTGVLPFLLAAPAVALAEPTPPSAIAAGQLKSTPQLRISRLVGHIGNSGDRR